MVPQIQEPWREPRWYPDLGSMEAAYPFLSSLCSISEPSHVLSPVDDNMALRASSFLPAPPNSFPRCVNGAMPSCWLDLPHSAYHSSHRNLGLLEFSVKFRKDGKGKLSFFLLNFSELFYFIRL